MLEVISHNETLVVDSRLVAEELGIFHTTLKESVPRHIEKLESLSVNGLYPLTGGTDNRLERIFAASV